MFPFSRIVMILIVTLYWVLAVLAIAEAHQNKHDPFAFLFAAVLALPWSILVAPICLVAAEVGLGQQAGNSIYIGSIYFGILFNGVFLIWFDLHGRRILLKLKRFCYNSGSHTDTDSQ